MPEAPYQVQAGGNVFIVGGVGNDDFDKWVLIYNRGPGGIQILFEEGPTRTVKSLTVTAGNSYYAYGRRVQIVDLGQGASGWFW